MFDSAPEGFDAETAIERFRAAEREAVIAHNQQFVTAAFWVDLHPTDGLPPADSVDATFAGERAIRIGGDGTPLVAESATASLAVETGWSVHKMRYFLTDAVDVRYRFPRIFARVRKGKLPRWTAQQISRAARDMNATQATQVEDILLPKIAGMTGKRLERLITAAMITVDAERFEWMAEQARRARYFRIGQGTDDGITTAYAQLDTPDAIRLKATVERVATILREHPGDVPGIKDRDAASADEWAAVALAVLAEPIRAAQLILEHEQPVLFDQAVEVFNPLHPRGWPHPAPRHYAINEPDVPVDHHAEPPVDESEAPADPIDDQPTTAPADHHTEPPADESEAPADPIDDQPTTAPADHHTEPPADESEAPADPIDDRPTTAPARRNHSPEECAAAVRAIIRAIPPEKLRSPISFHVHCAAEDLADGASGVVRIEEIGPTTLDWARRWFGADCTINLKPVIDPAGTAPLDAYEVSDRIREALLLRNPLSRFPYSNSLSRRSDIDHTIAFKPRRRWQTGLHNLGPFARPEHRYKTFGPITVRQPEPDLFVWRTRYGRVLIVDATGTHDLGTGAFARVVWTGAANVASLPVAKPNLVI